MAKQYDAVVIGSGPNGLAAAITLAQQGRSVVVVEGRERLGGGARTAELTLPGFQHDVCSAVHPLAVGGPFFPSLPLEKYGLEWLYSPSQLAHPLDDGTAVTLERSVEETAAGLGQDERAYIRLIKPLVDDWERLSDSLLGPIKLPHHPLALARFGWSAMRSAHGLTHHIFKEERARTLFTGAAAHSMLPLDQSPSAAFGLVLGILGHAVGWPIPRGGAQSLSEALAAYFRSLGGEIITGQMVKRLDELPDSRTIVFDLTPRQILTLASSQLPERYRRSLGKYRYGLAAFKLDYALSGPVPWIAAECARAATVHLGGTSDELTQSERQSANGQPPEKPLLILTQPSLFDPTRAPAGQHTLWVYAHVPNGSTFDMTERIEAQIERFAPGFKKLVLARHVTSPAEFESYNPNYIGGDINGGIQDLGQLFTRPVARIVPYSTPNPRLFICSSSTPPGGGVHGMCGYYAAQAVLKTLRPNSRI